MDNQQILHSDYLDILFEGRNKRYGGYALRKTYARRARSAMLTVLAAVSALIAGPVIASRIDKVQRASAANTEVHILHHPPVREQPKQLPVHVPTHIPAAAVVRKLVFVTAHDDSPELPAKMEETHDSVIGIQASKGEGLEQPDVSLQSGGGTVGMTEKPAADRTIYKKVEQLPQFPGDIEAFLNGPSPLSG